MLRWDGNIRMGRQENDMRKITFSLPDDLDDEMRSHLDARFGDTRGKLSTFLILAIREKLARDKN